MKSNRGGKRPNAGRKPVSDKKQQVSIYIKSSTLQKIKIMNKEIKKELTEFIKQTFENEDLQVVLFIIMLIGFCFADNIF